jgi:hypothetical protein
VEERGNYADFSSLSRTGFRSGCEVSAVTGLANIGKMKKPRTPIHPAPGSLIPHPQGAVLIGF